MLNDLAVEMDQKSADRRERLTREREAYGLAASELCRQLRVENKTRAALIEKIDDWQNDVNEMLADRYDEFEEDGMEARLECTPK